MNEYRETELGKVGKRWKMKALQKLVHAIFCRASSTLDMALSSGPVEKVIVSVMTDYIDSKPRMTSARCGTGKLCSLFTLHSPYRSVGCPAPRHSGAPGEHSAFHK